MMHHDSRSTAGRRIALRVGTETEDSPLAAGAPAVRFRTLTAAARRHLPTIVLWALLLPLLAGALYLAWPKHYEATTRLLVDPRGLSIVERDVTPRSESTDQLVSVVESELRIVTSDTVLNAVAEKLNLAQDPEFNGSERYFWSPLTDIADSLRSQVRKALGIAEPNANSDLTPLRNLRNAVRIERNPQSFVIDLSVRSNDGEKSARIANAIVEEYFDTRFSARSAATERASQAIAGRLDELRTAVEEADDKVEKYKREQGIIGAGGQLVNEQQLAEVNTQLGNARDEVGRAAAKVEQIRALRANKASPDSIAEVINSSTITQLRALQASIQQRYAAVTADMLPGHPDVKQVRQRLDATSKLIREEIDRIADTAQLDLKRARDTEQAIARRLGELKHLAQETNEKIVHLRELEREADARRSVYTNLLLRSRELDEQKRVDPSLASVLSPAVPPPRAGGPPMSWILAAAAFAGLGLGLSHAVARDYRDSKIRTAVQVQDHFAIPATRIPNLKLPTAKRRWLFLGPAINPALPDVVQTDPDLPTARALKGLAASILTSTGKASALLLVTSVDDERTKSAVALNLAIAAADLGERVLLIDADCERRALTEDIGADDKAGLENLAVKSNELGSAVHPSPEFDIDVMPNGRRSATGSNSPNQQLEKALTGIISSYDTVIVDAGLLPHGRFLPTLVGMANEIILVSRAGTTEKKPLAEAIALLEAAAVERLHAVVIEA